MLMLGLAKAMRSLDWAAIEAIKAYERAIEIDSEDYYAWVGKGIAFCELGRLGEAKNSMDKAYEILQRKIR
jgi:tetratricopeptide (TPR) repeat protein